MNNEMMILQARQDFIDIHKDLLAGKKLTLERYDSIAQDLKSLDDINFTWMLEFVEKTDNLKISQMWSQISEYIVKQKQNGKWAKEKHNYLVWKNEKLEVTAML